MNKKYHFKIDFSKASKSFANLNSLDVNDWGFILKSAKLKKYTNKSDKKHELIFSLPKKVTNKILKGATASLKKVLKNKKINFGNIEVSFFGKNLNSNFNNLTSISLKSSNKNIGKISYLFEKSFDKALMHTNKNLNYKKIQELVLVDLDKNGIVMGSNFNDKKLIAHGGQNKVHAGKGDDIILIEGKKNLIYGGAGNDILQVYNGYSHKLYGGKGKDIFKLNNGKGHNLIQDFKNKEDKIFIGSMNKLKLKNKGNDVYMYKGKDLLANVKGAKGDLSKKGKYFV